jgi:hypothetical protein
MFKLLLPFVAFAIVYRPDGTPYPAEFFEKDVPVPKKPLEAFWPPEHRKRAEERFAELIRIVDQIRKRRR